MSWASTDKTLGRLSAGATLVLLAGIVALALLPGRKTAKAPPRAETRSRVQVTAQAPGRAPAHAPPAAVKANAAAAANSTPPKPAEDVWTDAQRAAGLRRCLRFLAPVSVEVALSEPIKKGPCGTPAPVVLRSIGGAAKVKLYPAPEMNCRLAAGLARWVETVLQPAAREVLGSRIARIIGASSYACRNMYNKPDLPLSEHATANALDIAGFVTADGRTIRVATGWGPTERDIAEAQEKIAAAAKSKAKDKKRARALQDDADPNHKEAAKTSAPKEKASPHKTGFKAETGPRAPLVAATARLSAAKTRNSAFLKRLHRGACTVFGTVLGPEANEAHRDHFHFDMKARKGRGVCH